MWVAALIIANIYSLFSLKPVAHVSAILFLCTILLINAFVIQNYHFDGLTSGFGYKCDKYDDVRMLHQLCWIPLRAGSYAALLDLPVIMTIKIAIIGRN